MTFDAAGTGLNIPALSFGGVVFNQSHYLTITEGSAGISKALITNSTRESSSVSGALRCAGGIYAGGNCFFEKAITYVDGYGLVRTPAQPYITSVGTLTSLSTSGDITCGGNINGFLSYGNQSAITTVGRLTELTIGSTGTFNEYLSIRGSGSDYLDGSYSRMMHCYGSNATPIEFQIEVSNGTNATSSNAAWIGTRTNNDFASA
ncbi:hypothetical protein JG688_00018613 [Phytophthora aleatoria]|uniref:Uncharacterized protein n=1 Tax=Phytophthora aleatoria TaxID=2496075 RepID=A0A8J5IAM1_9STRA|nr:hypothetical protein JG688_00018613 [Phytophthora aleatoria]